MALLALQLGTATAQSTTADVDSLKKPVKMDVFTLNEMVIKSKFPWILQFVTGDHDHDEAVAAATPLGDQMDALARVGVVHSSQTKVLSKLGLGDVSAAELPKYRVYPFGEENKASPSDHEEEEAAVAAVHASLPDDLVEEITSGSYQPFVVSALKQKKLGAVLFTSKPGIPALAKKLGIWLGENFKFAVYPNADDNILRESGIAKVPSMILMVPQPSEAGADPGQMRLGVAVYDRAQFGGLKFKNIIQYCYAVRAQLKKEGLLNAVFGPTPEEEAAERAANDGPRSDLPMVPVFQATADTPDFCASTKLGLCVIGVLDGHPNNADLATQIEAMKAVQEMPINKGRPLHFSWVDITCHPTFAESIGIYADAAPTIIVISPKKMKYAQMLGGFTSDGISSFITGALGGRQRLFELQALPTINPDDDCAAAHKVEEVYEEEVDLDDIMSEILEDEKNEREAAEEEAANIMTAEEAEMEEKRRKAQAEMDRLNKKSAKSKKRRRRRRRNKKKAKDEL